MNPTNFTPTDPQEETAAPAHRALSSGRESFKDSSPHGEIFDVVVGENGEVEPAPDARRAPGAVSFLAILAALFCAFSAGVYITGKSKAPAPIGPFSTRVEAAPALRVQIVGLVKKPGVYTLTGGARLDDALKKAGGALPGADLSVLNLADWAADGSKIEVPAKRKTALLPTPTPQIIIKEVFVTLPENAPEGVAETRRPPAKFADAELADAKTEKAETTESPRAPGAKNSARNPRSSTGSSAVGAGPSTPPESKTSPEALETLRRQPVDINRAGAEQLATLPGVGPKMAERIIAYRRENGAFKAIADLDNVRGIGEKRIETLEPLIRFK